MRTLRSVSGPISTWTPLLGTCTTAGAASEHSSTRQDTAKRHLLPSDGTTSHEYSCALRPKQPRSYWPGEPQAETATVVRCNAVVAHVSSQQRAPGRAGQVTAMGHPGPWSSFLLGLRNPMVNKIGTRSHNGVVCGAELPTAVNGPASHMLA